MAESTHRLVLVDRCAGGDRHIHRWKPSCSCGRWWGINARTRAKARTQFAGHFSAAKGEKLKTRRRVSPGPQPLTPEHLLPEALRRTA